MTKKLSLRKDTLGELSTDDLRDVVGANLTQVGPPSIFQCGDLTGNYQTLPVWYCVTQRTGTGTN